MDGRVKQIGDEGEIGKVRHLALGRIWVPHGLANLL